MGYVALVVTGVAEAAFTDNTGIGVSLLVLLLPLVAYLVAGSLAPTHPWVTGGLLGFIHVAIVSIGLGGVDESADGATQLGQGLRNMVVFGFSLLVIGLGVVLTGILGHTAGAQDTGGR